MSFDGAMMVRASIFDSIGCEIRSGQLLTKPLALEHDIFLGLAAALNANTPPEQMPQQRKFIGHSIHLSWADIRQNYPNELFRWYLSNEKGADSGEFVLCKDRDASVVSPVEPKPLPATRPGPIGDSTRRIRRRRFFRWYVLSHLIFLLFGILLGVIFAHYFNNQGIVDSTHEKLKSRAGSIDSIFPPESNPTDEDIPENARETLPQKRQAVPENSVPGDPLNRKK